MKREVPLTLVFVFGMFMVFQYFVPHESSEWVYEFLLNWIYIIGIFALALGIWSMYMVAVNKIKHRSHAWGYSYITLAGLFSMLIFGWTSRNGEPWGFFFLFIASVLATIFLIMQATVDKGKSGLYSGLAGVCLVIAVLVAVFDNAWSFHFYTPEGQESTMFRNFFDFVMMPIMATVFSLLAFFISSAAYRAFRARNLLASLLLIAALIVMLRFNPYLSMILGDYMSLTSSWLMNVPNLAAQRAIVMGIGLGIVATALKVILGIERGYMGKG